GTLLLWGSITGRNAEEHELRPQPVPCVSFAADGLGTAEPGASKPVETVLVRAAGVGGYQLVAATPVVGDDMKVVTSEEVRRLLERRWHGDIDDNMWKPMIQRNTAQHKPRS